MGFVLLVTTMLPGMGKKNANDLLLSHNHHTTYFRDWASLTKNVYPA
jgi:hypothetical protein